MSVSQAQAAWHSFAAGMFPRRLTLRSKYQISVSATEHQYNLTARLQGQESLALLRKGKEE